MLNRSMKKSAKITASTIIVVLVAAVLFYSNAGPAIVSEYASRTSKDNLDFSFGFCGDELASEKPLSSNWIDENTLLVTGTATPNCGTSWIFGDYAVDENNLTLTYKPVMPYLFACICNYDVEYEITNLERREYNIKLVESEGIYQEPELFLKLLSLFE